MAILDIIVYRHG